MELREACFRHVAFVIVSVLPCLRGRYCEARAFHGRIEKSSKSDGKGKDAMSHFQY